MKSWRPETAGLLAAFFMVAASYALAQDFQPTVEDKTNRPGFDFHSFNPPGPDARYCLSGCLLDSQCRAWVYQIPQSTADGRPLCWLKYDISNPGPQPNFVAGVVRPSPTPEAGTPTKISYHRPDGNGDLTKVPNNTIWQETTPSGSKFNFRSAVENRTEIVLYDGTRDFYLRADFAAHKLYIRNGRGGWSAHSDIVGTE
jgi:hypothetical protein